MEGSAFALSAGTVEVARMAVNVLADIVSIFVREANQRFVDMTRALDALDLDFADAAALDALMRHFHGFAGVGGVDGFDLINILGDRGECACRHLLGAGIAPAAEHVRRWRSTVDVMRGEIEKMQRDTAAAQPVSIAPRRVRRIYDVLIVDADPLIHARLTVRLHEQGFNVSFAYSRADAMECLMVQRPHALIIDVALPDGSGYDVIERLRNIQGREQRREEGRDNTAVLIVSEHGAFLDRVAAIRAGADDSVDKTADCDRLARRLRELVQSRDESVARILSVEDDLAQAAYLRSVLEGAGYDVRTCADPRTFESDLTGFAPDLILMDILLPEVSGYELARVARQECQTTPILFLTTEGQFHTRIQSMRSGGDDHMVKPVEPNVLLSAVEARIERARQIRQFLDRDNLTGLLNRAAFLRRLQARIRRADDREAALVMLDVDRFKLLNDHHGHAFGDQVLCRLATFLGTHVRLSDSVCRYGGEEFTMLIDDVSESDAVRLLDRLRDDFASIAHLAPGGKTVFATFSAGVTTLPADVSGIARSLESADAAMYRAKGEGRNRVVGVAPRFPARISA
jgi:diguanylate cyclase (GGDEF)-like protein